MKRQPILLASLAIALASLGAAGQTDPVEEPSVRVSWPRPGAVVYGPTRIQAETTVDPSQVDRVEFFVDGAHVGTDTDRTYGVQFDFGRTRKAREIRALLYRVERAEPLTDTLNTQDMSVREFVSVAEAVPREYRLQVRVNDATGRPVDDLDLGDFSITFGDDECADAREVLRLFDDGRIEEARARLVEISGSQCQVSYFADPSAGRRNSRAIAVAVDISGSIAQRLADGSPSLKRFEELSGYVGSSLSAAFDPRDVYVFARFSSVLNEAEPTHDARVLGQLMRQPYDPEWGSGTPYFTTVKLMTDRLERYARSPKAILMFSDCVPRDAIDAGLDDVTREMQEAVDPRKLEGLKTQRRDLLEQRTEAMARTLMHALEVGVPVYNIHYADENTAAAAAKKAECHAWVLRTGGNVFYLTDSHNGVREIVEQVAEDTSHTYILAVRRAGSKSGPRVKLRGRDGWKITHTGEFQSFESRAATLAHRINAGTPAERLEAAFFARRFVSKGVREALRRQVQSEGYEPVRRTMVDSLYAIALSEVCSEDRKRRQDALRDLNAIHHELGGDGEQWRMLGAELETCVEHRDFRESMLIWWQSARDPQVRSLLYSTNIEALRRDLHDERVSEALRRAEVLGGDGVRTILEQYLEAGEPPGKARRQVEQFLASR